MTYPATENQSALDVLENKVDLLIENYHALKHENETLVTHQALLQEEKIQLLQKAAQARTRVEAMVNRLKTMGQGL